MAFFLSLSTHVLIFTKSSDIDLRGIKSQDVFLRLQM